MLDPEIQRRHIRELLAPIASLLDSAEVSEVMINGPSQVYAERRGRIERESARFEDAEALMSALRGVAQWAGLALDAEHPILEARLPDGSRLEAVIPPASPEHPVVTVRRFTAACAVPFAQLGVVDEAGLSLLQKLVADRRNIVIAGGTGSGKTTILNALCGLIDPNQRLVVIEDARELQLPHEHVVHLQARPADVRGRGAISVRQLFRATLRLRPDRIVVGEIRGGEALEMIQAMTSGHGGCLSTVHATCPEDALRRLETLALMSEIDLPIESVRAQLTSAVDVIVQTARGADGARAVSRIVEVEQAGTGYRLRELHGDGVGGKRSC